MAILRALQRAALLALLPVSVSLLAGCGDGDTTLATPRAAYLLGGSISGLNSAGLVLGNGATQLTVAAGASAFTLPIPVVNGIAYSVTVVTQPAGLTCTVSHGAGTMPANNVSGLVVICAENAY